MYSVVAAASLLFSVIEENEAEKLFRAFETKLATAKTVRVSGTATIENGKAETTAEIVCLFDQNCKARLQLDAAAQGNKVQSLLISNGKTILISRKLILKDSERDLPEVEFDCSKHFTATLRGGISRNGLAVALAAFRQDFQEVKEPFNVDREFRIADFKMLPAERIDGREMKVISYASGDEKDGAVTIWFDSATLLPKKRSTSTKVLRVVETFKEFVLDPKIEAGAFDFPAQKAVAMNDAEKLFRAFAEKVTAAKAIKVSGSSKSEGGKSEGTTDFSILIAQENKASITAKMKTANLDLEFRLKSDGRTTRIFIGREMSKDRDTPKRLERLAKEGLISQGLVAGFLVINLIDAIDLTSNRVFAASQFAMKASEKIDGRDCTVITYKTGNNDDTAITLWIDAKTQLPVKRMTVTDTGAKGTELIREFVIDPKLADSAFDLAK